MRVQVRRVVPRGLDDPPIPYQRVSRRRRDACRQVRQRAVGGEGEGRGSANLLHHLWNDRNGGARHFEALKIERHRAQRLRYRVDKVTVREVFGRTAAANKDLLHTGLQIQDCDLSTVDVSIRRCHRQ
jgi:hypothetical protein